MILGTLTKILLGLVMFPVAFCNEGICISCAVTMSSCACSSQVMEPARHANADQAPAHGCPSCHRSDKTAHNPAKQKCACPAKFDQNTESSQAVLLSNSISQLVVSLSTPLPLITQASWPSAVNSIGGNISPQDTLYLSVVNEPLFITNCLLLL